MKKKLSKKALNSKKKKLLQKEKKAAVRWSDSHALKKVIFKMPPHRLGPPD